MEKCRDCNSTLKAGELECYNCGTPVKVQDTPQIVFGKRFVSFLNIAFFASCGLTLLSLFGLEFTPRFMPCLVLTFILLLIRSSASQMLEKKRD